MDLLENTTVFAGAQNGGWGLGGGWAYRGGEAARQRLQHPAAAAVGSKQCGRSQLRPLSPFKQPGPQPSYPPPRRGG